jgi:hypothetical protein
VNKQNIGYWIATALMSVCMLMGAVADVSRAPAALAWFVHLGYPLYLLPFIGAAKILGVLAVVAPGIKRVKEWAYAGLVFDLIGAFYSHISVGDSVAIWILPMIGLLLVISSYVLYQRKKEHETACLSASYSS